MDCWKKKKKAHIQKTQGHEIEVIFQLTETGGFTLMKKIYMVLTCPPTQENETCNKSSFHCIRCIYCCSNIKLEGKPHYLTGYLNVQNNSIQSYSGITGYLFDLQGNSQYCLKLLVHRIKFVLEDINNNSTLSATVFNSHWIPGKSFVAFAPWY